MPKQLESFFLGPVEEALTPLPKSDATYLLSRLRSIRGTQGLDLYPYLGQRAHYYQFEQSRKGRSCAPYYIRINPDVGVSRHQYNSASPALSCRFHTLIGSISPARRPTPDTRHTLPLRPAASASVAPSPISYESICCTCCTLCAPINMARPHI